MERRDRESTNRVSVIIGSLGFATTGSRKFVITGSRRLVTRDFSGPAPNEKVGSVITGVASACWLVCCNPEDAP